MKNKYVYFQNTCVYLDPLGVYGHYIQDVGLILCYWAIIHFVCVLHVPPYDMAKFGMCIIDTE